jgi:hypothetical protein
MEQTECECPCECLMETDMCTGGLASKDATNPSCPHMSESPRPAILADMVAVNDMALPSCMEHNCQTYISHR